MILTPHGVAEPLFQPEGFFDNVTVRLPQAVALWAVFVEH
jgi:hypothetical protein